MKDFNELGKEVLNLLFKSRSGVYQDTSENRRKHRVGQRYGKESGLEVLLDEVLSSKNSVKEFEEYLAYLKDTNAPEAEISKVEADLAEKKKKAASAVEAYEKEKGKKSKNEIRTERLKKYQEALSKVREKLNDPNISEESKKMGKDLEAKWVEKISKLEKKLGKKAKTEEPETSTKETKESKVVNKIVEQISKRNPNFSDERIARVKEVLLKNEKDVSKFIGGKFPSSAGGSSMFPNKNSIKLETGDEIVFQSFSEKDTTSRSPRFRVGTNHYYRIVAKYGSIEKELYRTTYTKDLYRPENPSEIKERCKVEALMRYFHI